jgi:uncharacterized surface protein with fasciclin (FAS1) repeats
MKAIMNGMKMSLIIMLGAITFASCSTEDPDDMPAPSTTLADLVNETPRFSTLKAALERANLIDAIDGVEMYTVFAPNNDAFAQLLTNLNVSNLDELVTAVGGEDELAQILLYHLVSGKVMAADVTTGYVNTLAVFNGQANEFLSAYVMSDNGVRINDAADVIMTDIKADNGVIHEIDAVILPMNVAEIASMSDDFSTLMAAVGAADAAVATRLTSTSDVTTVFAPTNAAFADLLTRAGVADLNELLNAIGQAGLTQVLLYHTLDGNVRSTDLADGNVMTLQGSDVMVNVSDPSITDANMDKAMVLVTDVQGSNGVVHVIDFVIQP